MVARWDNDRNLKTQDPGAKERLRDETEDFGGFLSGESQDLGSIIGKPLISTRNSILILMHIMHTLLEW